jgi:hypothetical protein
VGHSREASTTAFLRIMSRIGANVFEHFRRAALRSGFQFIAMPARYEFADPLTLISARRTLTCRRNGLSRCFAVMSQLPTLCGSSAEEPGMTQVEPKWTMNLVRSRILERNPSSDLTLAHRNVLRQLQMPLRNQPDAPLLFSIERFRGFLHSAVILT